MCFTLFISFLSVSALPWWNRFPVHVSLFTLILLSLNAVKQIIATLATNEWSVAVIWLMWYCYSTDYREIRFSPDLIALDFFLFSASRLGAIGSQPRIDPNEDAFDAENEEGKKATTEGTHGSDVDEESAGEKSYSDDEVEEESPNSSDEEDILPSPLSIRQQRTNQAPVILNSTSLASNSNLPPVKSVESCEFACEWIGFSLFLFHYLSFCEIIRLETLTRNSSGANEVRPCGGEGNQRSTN